MHLELHKFGVCLGFSVVCAFVLFLREGEKKGKRTTLQNLGFRVSFCTEGRGEVRGIFGRRALGVGCDDLES